jgi:hypothetical protein
LGIMFKRLIPAKAKIVKIIATETRSSGMVKPLLLEVENIGNIYHTLLWLTKTF